MATEFVKKPDFQPILYPGTRNSLKFLPDPYPRWDPSNLALRSKSAIIISKKENKKGLSYHLGEKMAFS